MPRFSEHLASVRPRLDELAGLRSPLRPLEAILETAGAGRGLTPEDVASLIAWGREAERRAEIHAAARALREAVGGRTIEFIIPEYLTSFCQNDCLYCGYRKSNMLAERVRLSLEEYERELDLILAWGHRQIELVLADDPEFGAEQAAPYVALTRRKLNEVGGGMVALNAPAYDEAGYRRLWSAGLDWVALWQETYDATQFGRWHFQGSPKRQYEFRLDVWDRVIPAGFTRVAPGVLFGLYDWRIDVLALVEHAGYLRKTYGLEPYALGIPRLKPARGVLASQKPSRFTVSDDDYRLAVSLYHLAFPRTRLFFNTRETYEFNMSMVARGDLFTVDCETLPGAYVRGTLPGQFATHSYPPRREVVAEFARRGYGCRYLEPEDSERLARLETMHADAFTPEHLRRSACEHWEIRAKLDEWEKSLEELRITSAHLRWVAAEQLRERLRYFGTTYIAHCRHEENILQASLAEKPEWAERVAGFRLEHERFSVDLDRLERQMTSYEQSGDPTVILMLGNRMIAELREHLNSEDRYFAHWLEAGASPPVASP
jgi:2-iminoacetate synthase ThiH